MRFGCKNPFVWKKNPCFQKHWEMLREDLNLLLCRGNLDRNFFPESHPGNSWLWLKMAYVKRNWAENLICGEDIPGKRSEKNMISVWPSKARIHSWGHMLAMRLSSKNFQMKPCIREGGKNVYFLPSHRWQRHMFLRGEGYHLTVTLGSTTAAKATLESSPGTQTVQVQVKTILAYLQQGWNFPLPF